MAEFDGSQHHYDADDAIPALDAYPAGKNHEDLLLCGANNDTEWIMSDHFDDLEVWR